MSQAQAAPPVSSLNLSDSDAFPRKGSDELYAAIRARLGEPLWRFATGQTDTLRDTEPTRCHPSTK